MKTKESGMAKNQLELEEINQIECKINNLVMLSMIWLLYDCQLIVCNSLSVIEIESYKSLKSNWKLNEFKQNLI